MARILPGFFRDTWAMNCCFLSPWGHDPPLGLGLTTSSSAQHGPHTASGPEYGLSLDKSLTVSGFKHQARDFWCLSHLRGLAGLAATPSSSLLHSAHRRDPELGQIVLSFKVFEIHVSLLKLEMERQEARLGGLAMFPRRL